MTAPALPTAAAASRAARNALADVNNALADVNITLASLPEYVQEKLKAFDVDGDGFISLAEILRHRPSDGAELEQSKQHVAVRCGPCMTSLLALTRALPILCSTTGA